MSKRKTEVIPEKIHVVAVNIIQANLETTDKFLDNPVSISNFQVQMGHETAFNTPAKLARYRLYITLEAVDEKEAKVGASVYYGIEFRYQINNLEDFVIDEKDDHPMIDVNIGTTLLAMSYSTARGIIYERTRGTFFNGVLIPVIDPSKVLLEQQGKSEVK